MDISVHKNRQPIPADESKCAGCRTCMLRCSFQHQGAFNLSAARIQVQKLVHQNHEFRISFTEDCDFCGVCATYCPYGALTRPQKVRVGD